MTKWDLFQRCKEGSTFTINQCDTTIKKMKDKSHKTISNSAEKASEKFHIYDKPQLTYSTGKAESFFSKIRKKIRMPTLATFLNLALEVLARAIRQEKGYPN